MKNKSQQKPSWWAAHQCRHSSSGAAYVILLGLLFMACSPSAQADESILLQRIVALEKRLAELEGKLAPVLEEERVKSIVAAQKARARERMMIDPEFYSRLDLRLIEKLYQTINNNWESEDAQKSLQLLTQKYPRANQTGCAVLYLGQMTKDSEQLNSLHQAIEQYGSSYYSNGVNVGAYARLYLGMRYQNEGKEKEARKLFDDILTHFPDAIDHKGKLLSSHIKGLE
ncbi:MAG: tetratricopeptide repeat protein [Pontiella sp.]